MKKSWSLCLVLLCLGLCPDNAAAAPGRVEIRLSGYATVPALSFIIKDMLIGSTRQSWLRRRNHPPLAIWCRPRHEALAALPRISGKSCLTDGDGRPGHVRRALHVFTSETLNADLTALGAPHE